MDIKTLWKRFSSFFSWRRLGQSKVSGMRPKSQMADPASDLSSRRRILPKIWIFITLLKLLTDLRECFYCISEFFSMDIKTLWKRFLIFFSWCSPGRSEVDGVRRKSQMAAPASDLSSRSRILPKIRISDRPDEHHEKNIKNRFHKVFISILKNSEMQ